MNLAEKKVSAPGSALLSAAALAGFILVFIEAASFGVGASLFPRVLGVVGALSAAAVLIQSLLQLRATASGTAVRALKWKDVLISYVGPPVYALLIYLTGFWIASTLSLAGLLVLLGERRAWLVAAITAGTLGAIYLMFEFSFGIRMPRGWLLA